jgi:hypothetical protein
LYKLRQRRGYARGNFILSDRQLSTMRFFVDWNGKEKYNYNSNHASSYKQWDGIMAQTMETMEELTVPDGGIGNFVMDDDEIEAAYGEEKNGEEDYGDEGIAQFSEITKKMAAQGREGDDVVGHLQTGELVIPLALIEQDEALKEGIFQRLRDMGVEDPERYVVGSDANSINPATGAPEFFLGKLVKGIVNTVKKVVKSVVNVVKKVAPIVLPIVGTMFLGPVYGAALGSGIATLINGGNVKDALKSALFAGATGGLMAGVSGAMSGVGFKAGVQAAFNPANISAGFGALKTGFTEGFGQTGVGFGSMKYGLAGGEQINAQLAQQAAMAAPAATEPTMRLSTMGTDGAGAVTTEGVQQGATNLNVAGADTAGQTVLNGAPVTTQQVAQNAVTLNKPPTFMQSMRDAFTPGGRTFTQSMGDAFFPSAQLSGGNIPAGESIVNPSVTDYLTASGITPINASVAQQTAAQSAISAASPGVIARYAPLAAAGLGVAAATGAFTPVAAEPLDVAMRDEEGNVVTGEDIVAGDPGKYKVADLGDYVLDPNTGNYVPRPSYSAGMVENLYSTPVNYSSYSVPTQYQYNPGTYLQASNPSGPFARPYVTQAAEGGAIFPRRYGGIMPDEGIPGQDSVRAMLMPGEFVMTTDAVRGLGNGNLNNGIQNMYSVMRNLESRGRAMA